MSNLSSVGLCSLVRNFCRIRFKYTDLTRRYIHREETVKTASSFNPKLRSYLIQVKSDYDRLFSKDVGIVIKEESLSGRKIHEVQALAEIADQLIRTENELDELRVIESGTIV